MAATDATPSPVRAQAFRTSFRIPVTGGLTGLAAQISKDGGTFGATTSAPVEIGTTGYGYLDLTATEMTCSSSIVRIYCTNATGYEVSLNIFPLVLTSSAGRWDAQTVLRMEQILVDLHDFLYNQQDNTGAAQTVYTAAGLSKVTGVVVEGDVTGTRGKLS